MLFLPVLLLALEVEAGVFASYVQVDEKAEELGKPKKKTKKNAKTRGLYDCLP